MNLFKHLLSQAQFHGSNRLTERKHRNWWAVALALSMWAATSITLATISRFVENPAYLIITETTGGMMTFPSVVLCPEIKYPQYKVDAFLSNLKYPPEFNKNEIKSTIRQLAAFYSPDVKYSVKVLKKVEDFLNYNDLNVEIVTKLLSLNCEESILRCRLFGVIVNCSSIFSMELTDYGYCCIFNGRSLKRELDVYSINKTKPPPVLYSDKIGHNSGLMFIVNSSQTMDDVDLSYKWLYLEKGQEFAESGRNGTPITVNEEFWVSYRTQRFVIEEKAEENRHCRLTSEKLKYFPYYFREYCKIECEMARIMQRCHCVKLTHPKPPNWNYCTAKYLRCVQKSAVTADQCDCPQTCDATVTFFKIRNFPLSHGNFIIDPIYKGLNFSKITVVRAFFLQHDNKYNTRRSYYTSENLLTQIGGIMNVFFGCSILTILELIQLLWYGCRQYRTVKRIQKKRKKKEYQPSTDDKNKDVGKNQRKVILKKKTVRFRK